MSAHTAAQAAASASAGPRISVVAVWGPDRSGLPSWLSRVASAAGRSRVEVVVVVTEAEDLATAAAVESHATHRNLRLVQVRSSSPAGAMRRAGMAAATGDVVLLTDFREGDFELRLAALLRQFEARWGSLGLTDSPDAGRFDPSI